MEQCISGGDVAAESQTGGELTGGKLIMRDAAGILWRKDPNKYRISIDTCLSDHAKPGGEANKRQC
ncbi:hypothetical protein BDV36DRAFT_245394 [Aspergillus pseudocaelatus]|uniref:Uncharacterized protein n=1 Tax=Aspergillus pseudocaelatus TaxID=1825620 RepID=A0ABQ6WZM6_9EURO|nr:hypothetical protein BDV36DRAFT_245394 [Aspergillus pseudocaelatus]